MCIAWQLLGKCYCPAAEAVQAPSVGWFTWELIDDRDRRLPRPHLPAYANTALRAIKRRKRRRGGGVGCVD